MRFAVIALMSALAFGPTGASASPGDLDRSFSDDGRATAFFRGWRLGNEIADLDVGDDGRAVIATEMVHHTGGVRTDPAIAAFKTNGQPDRGFSRNGQLILETRGWDSATRVAVQPNGRVLVANDAHGGPRLYRLNRDGRLNRDFGDDGSVGLDLLTVRGVDVQANGDVLVFGGVREPSGVGQDFAVLRLDRSGRPDPAFGDAGLATVDFLREGDSPPSAEFVTSLAARPDGGLILCGHSQTSSGGYAEGYRDDVVLAALRNDGTLDDSFGDAGRVYAGPESGTPSEGVVSGGGMGVAVTERGEIVVGGTVHEDFTASVYTPFGRPDTLFGEDGTAVVDMRRGSDDADGVAAAPGGRVYLAGSVGDRKERDYAVLRLTARGTVDTNFGDSGLAVADFNDDYDDADRIEVLPNGAVLVAGTVGSYRIGLLRIRGR